MLPFLQKAAYLILFTTVCSIQANAQVVDKIVAKVDNHIILKSELEIAYLQFLRSPEAQLLPDKSAIKCRVLESLIINKMMLAKAAMDSVTVEREQVNGELDRRMNYFISQFGSVEKLEKYYDKTIDQLKQDLYAQIRDQLIIQKMQQQITSAVKITPGEVEKFYKTIPKDSLPYFSSSVEVGQIVRYAEINRTDKLQYRKKAEEIRQRILSGEDFCRLAKNYSDDPVSAKNCGEIGFFKKGELVTEYESVALRLKPGETSEVIESQFGFHIMQLIERRGNEFNTRHILIRPSTSGKDLVYPAQILDSVRQLISIDSISFSRAVKNYSADKATLYSGGMFTDQQTGSSQIQMEDMDPDVFMIIDTMQVGQITAPILYKTADGDDAVRIIYLKSKTPAHQANLKDDYQKIQNAALDQKKQTAIDKWFDKTKNQVYIDIDNEYKDCQILINQ
ncbi:MAG: peptidylprolyl isomerase [Cytophagaceae bacterium]|jgi:peptidyl-prolyl cis-trans isomerase SurA|nr:peptidylprolyl isomerase [Cytophagaceae bacterium]